jgi:5-methylcytosine-specific restriction endonuclease McrA
MSDTYKGLKSWRFALTPANVKEKLFRSLMYERDNGRCGLCGKKVEYMDMDVDHVVPASKGGANVWSNLQISHIRCNRSKGNRVTLSPAARPPATRPTSTPRGSSDGA